MFARADLKQALGRLETLSPPMNHRRKMNHLLIRGVYSARSLAEFRQYLAKAESIRFKLRRHPQLSVSGASDPRPSGESISRVELHSGGGGDYFKCFAASLSAIQATSHRSGSGWPRLAVADPASPPAGGWDDLLLESLVCVPFQVSPGRGRVERSAGSASKV